MERTRESEARRAKVPETERSFRLGPSELLQVLAGVAGFGALAYGVGAAIMWLRFATTGFPADVALGAVPQTRLVVLGARSLMIWGLLVLAILGLALIAPTLRRRARMLTTRSQGSSEREEFGDALADRPVTHRHLVWPLVGVAAVIGAAFVTWSAFTIAAALLATIVFARWYRQKQTASSRPGRWPLVVFVAAVSALVSIGWQLQINLPYDHAEVLLKREPASSVRDGIYFGESQGSVYFSPREDEPSRAFTRSIGVYPKEEIETLEILPGDQTLCSRVADPATSLWRGLEDLAEIVDQHLSETGEREPEPEEEPTEPLPQGVCPQQ
jgi:hypothetical protein